MAGTGKGELIACKIFLSPRVSETTLSVAGFEPRLLDGPDSAV